MSDHEISRSGATLHARVEGIAAVNAPTVVFANSLGTDMRLWDAILPLLPDSLRTVRFDKRGHGRSSVPPAPYTMADLVSDAEAVGDELGVRDCVFVGCSIGGMIAQGLAGKRPDIVGAAVLSNTAARIGTPQLWADRVSAVREHGIEALADGIIERWFTRPFRESGAVRPWRALLVSTPVEGYAGCCEAIAGADLHATAAALRLPVLGIAGSEDGATSPDLVRGTIDAIPGARYQMIRQAGHLPCVEKPEEFADLLTAFLRETGRV